MNYCETLIAVSYLTDREIEVLRLMDKRNKIIAKQLSISDSTVKAHVRHIMDKLRCRNREELVKMLMEYPYAA